MISLKGTVVVFLSVILLDFTSVSASKNEPLIGYKEVGKASFYANKFQGRKTASGELFNQNAKTAAHKKLPFGTKVKVTNINTGQHIEVRINDRGPFVKGRIIDLSRSAFKVVGDLNSGIIKVRIEVIK